MQVAELACQGQSERKHRVGTSTLGPAYIPAYCTSQLVHAAHCDCMPVNGHQRPSIFCSCTQAASLPPAHLCPAPHAPALPHSPWSALPDPALHCLLPAETAAPTQLSPPALSPNPNAPSPLSDMASTPGVHPSGAPAPLPGPHLPGTHPESSPPSCPPRTPPHSAAPMR